MSVWVLEYKLPHMKEFVIETTFLSRRVAYATLEDTLENDTTKSEFRVREYAPWGGDDHGTN